MTDTFQLEAEIAELRADLKETKDNVLSRDDVVNMFPELLQNIDSRIFIHNNNLEFHNNKIRRIAIGTGDFGAGSIAFYDANKNLVNIIQGASNALVLAHNSEAGTTEMAISGGGFNLQTQTWEIDIVGNVLEINAGASNYITLNATVSAILCSQKVRVPNKPPSTAGDNTVDIFSTDLSAGNTQLSWSTEGTSTVGTGTPTADRTISVKVNGTQYYLLASTTSS